MFPMSQLRPDTLADIVATLGKQRTTTLVDESSYFASSRSLCPPGVVQSIYSACVYLELDVDVYHLSVELFELFMNRHVKDLSEAKVERNLSPESIVASMGNMKRQVWLRLISCVLIAAKFQRNSPSKVTRMREKALFLLKEINSRIRIKTLDRSEMRVLKVSRNDSNKRKNDLFTHAFVLCFRP